ncbi:antichymotrypsin-2 isoform X3 [Copidosoma floridanum]|uniref:antichymotrypsin-2 isoform X3 n=1 Tax=Copidosoma floridanum TaxID=29053 RepID=UPI0006C9CEB2|nr:antichymotrypsin-2 isoform X3 [Copidosoma floridanum]
MRFHTISLALVLCAVCTMAQDKSALKAVSESSERFATKFFKTVSKENDGKNVISSPVSAYSVLSMAAMGAGGRTARQMRTSLSLPADDSVSLRGMQTLMDEINNVKNVTLEMANKMYVAKSLKVKPSFNALATDSFRSEAADLDISNPSAAVKEVNNWVDQKTHHKIEKILEDGDIDGDTRMVILNAVYFKGKWAKPFENKQTEDKPFYYMENKTRKEKLVPTMYVKGDFFYGEMHDLKAKFIELPYQNKDIRMVIIVPDEVDGLSKVEQNLEAFNYNRLTTIGFKREVELYMPKFKVESTLDLKAVLEKMGMTDMFTDYANFSGISDQPIKVGKVLQKAFIEVNEEGSEAAAVTALRFVAYSAIYRPEPIYVLKVDRPFVFTIIDTRSRITLFKGHVEQL